MMKISSGLWGTHRIAWSGVIAMLLLLPCFAYPQQASQAIDTVAIRKSKYLATDVANIASQDSTRQVRNISQQDTVLDVLPAIKPDYSNFTLIIQINDGQQYTRSKEVNLSLTAPQAIDMIVANKADLSSGQWEPFQSFKRWTLTGEDGNHVVYLQVRYPDSLLSDIVSDEIILSSTPPVAKFQVTPDSGLAGETWFSFDATACSHHFDIYLRWDWDGDGQFDTDWSQSKQEMYQYRLGGGSKEVRLEVKDNSGWVIASTHEIFVYSRPHPDFSYAQDFEKPLTITFDAAGSGDYEDGNNLQYRWDFNADSLWDSDWTAEKTITYTFPPFDKIQVMVEAKDSQALTNSYASTVVNNFYNMVYVPAGNFIMGHNEFEIDERPAHEVFLDAFWIDKYPVTNKAYADFLNEFMSQYPERQPDVSRFIDLSDKNPKIQFEAGKYLAPGTYDDHPVVDVTWFGAQAFGEFYGKRLPTEAEWEKAARGTDQRIYAWGSSVDSSMANYWDSGDPYEDNTTPVGFYNGQKYNGFQTNDSQSFYGIYDMGGNVKEWVLDWYARNYYSQSPQLNPQGYPSGEKKVVRGGGFLFHPDHLRATFRYAMLPDRSAIFIGFRCVKSAVK